ncbi:acyltransferase family protein [Nocardioides sp. zg-579]|uniref:Acyltransferase family protein n=1 Tax=Nocardioides marmotae TaxID=2663857 RepID=A0A6I3JA52_9ACTN|nr:acyltransferase family protein [Gordonia jinghuaiqii]MTB94908.1 acyltransferase family protein [Nocardioides marmotae]
MRYVVTLVLPLLGRPAAPGPEAGVWASSHRVARDPGGGPPVGSLPGDVTGAGGMARALRGDIQGLRAIAVLVVVAAHAGVAWLPGGFVGVDVFFVISGYLIAGLLYREVDRDGRFSLLGFWSRRARRILPAATVVTAVTVLTALSWFSLLDARQVVADSAWAALFAANIHFARQGVDYFASDLGVSPLQHYWSLAVEEQFYVVWPLLLLACLGLARLLRRRSGQQESGPAGLPRRAVAAVLVAVTAASFAWSVLHTAAEPTAAYFSTLTRAWELGLGALVALVPATALRRLGRAGATALAATGLAMIAVACVVITGATAFPGYAAALPVVGTALVLVAGAGAAAPVTTAVLAWGPLRTIGDWSYSLYLWHWPALVLPAGLLGRPLRAWESAAAVAAAFALAAVTYTFVERPFRDGRPARALGVRRALVLYPASLALVAATGAGTWWWTGERAEAGDNPAITADGATHPDDPDGTVALVRASVDAARERRAVPSDLSPDLLDLRASVADVGECDYATGVRRLCPRGDLDADRSVVLIGDSHARAWIPAFDRIAEEGGWTAYYLVMSQCTAAHVVVAPIDAERPFTECTDFHDWVGEQVADLDPDLVVVTSSPPVNGVFDGGERYEALDRVAPLLADGYDDLFADLGRAADRVVLLRDVPKSSYDPGTCLTTGSPDLADCSFVPVERSRRLGDIAVTSARLAGTEVVDPTPWLCYQDLCPVVIGGTLTYRDTDHLTTEYAASLAGALGRALHMLDRS